MLYVGGLFRAERVQHRLPVAGRMQAALNTQLGDQFGKAEAAGNDADGTDNGRRLGIDSVRRAGQPVAAGRADIFDKGIDLDVVFRRQVADAPGDQRRLHRRAARRIDRQRHRRQVLGLEGAFDARRQPLQAETPPEAAHGADDAGQRQHRDDGFGRAPALDGHERAKGIDDAHGPTITAIPRHGESNSPFPYRVAARRPDWSRRRAAPAAARPGFRPPLPCGP